MEADEEIYLLVNSNGPIPKGKYNPADYRSVKRMQNFLSELKESVRRERLESVVYQDVFPDINGCISKFQLSDSMFCYIMCNGTAVFLEYGKEIPFDDVRYFSIPVFLERQKYEDDYCINRNVSEQKRFYTIFCV